MYGADADELDRLAAEFRRAADELDADGGQMTRLLSNVAWVGDVAGRFVGEWTGVRIPQVGLSTRFLREAADRLAANAAEQRQASGAGGGALRSTPAPDVGKRSGGAWDSLEKALKNAGMAPDVVKAILDGFKEFLGPDQVQDLLEGWLTADMLGALGAIGKGFDIAKVLVAMAADYAANAHLPMDERMVRAVTVAAISVAMSAGVKTAVSWGMAKLGLIAGSVVPVAGNAAGFVIGKVVGYGVGHVLEGVLSNLDGSIGASEMAVDAVLEAYRAGRDASDAIGDVVSDAVDVISDLGGSIVDGITGGIDDAAQLIGGWFN